MTKEEVTAHQFKHCVKIQIRFNDLDMNGHVNNGIYHSYFDMGRSQYFCDVLQAKTCESLIVQVNTSYAKSVIYGDTICIKSSIIRWGTTSFDILQGVFRTTKEQEELVVYNVTTFVHITDGKPTPIPEVWKERVKKYENF